MSRPQPSPWPMKSPDDYLDYSFDATAAITGDGTISQVSLAIAPSGTGELAADRLSVSGSLITVWLNAGRAGRSYLIKLEATMSTGRVHEWFLSIAIGWTDESVFVAPASADFGPAVTWTG